MYIYTLSDIINQYNTSFRTYHNWKHITDMIHFFQKHAFLSDEVVEAILYHDIVYDVAPNKLDAFSNETLSGLCYLERSETKSIHVAKMIFATEFHFTDKEFPNDISLFLDVDLNSLVTEDRDFLLKTNNDIDQEFVNFGHRSYDVITKRYDFIKNVMKPNARMRVLHQYNDILKSNIEFLEKTYEEKLLHCLK